VLASTKLQLLLIQLGVCIVVLLYQYKLALSKTLRQYSLPLNYSYC
jgi:hypothetical protein